MSDRERELEEQIANLQAQLTAQGARIAALERALDTHNQRVAQEQAEVEKETEDFNHFIEDLETWAKTKDDWIEEAERRFETVRRALLEMPDLYAERSTTRIIAELQPYFQELDTNIDALDRQLQPINALLESLRLDDNHPPLAEAVPLADGTKSLRRSRRELLTMFDHQRRANPDLTLADWTREMGIEDVYRSLLSERSRLRRVEQRPRRAIRKPKKPM